MMDKRKLLRGIFGTLSLTTALFVFQACYGTPHDFGSDVLVKGKVTQAGTNKPLEGIRVSIANGVQYTSTDSLGNYSIYTSKEDSVKVTFASVTNGVASTLLGTTAATVNKKVLLNVSLDIPRHSNK